MGRYANRIAGGRFELDGVVHELSQNERGNTLHGGLKGFDSRVWVAIDPDPGVPSLTLRYTAPDGEMGFRGRSMTEVAYRLEERSLDVGSARSPMLRRSSTWRAMRTGTSPERAPARSTATS